MRIDHIAYQRATRVAALGFFVQAAVGILLLLFSMMTGESGDTAFRFGAFYVLCGLIVWLSLIIVFHQHKLERLEALEEDQLAGRDASGSIFDAADEEIRVAARRLRLMHKWMMPIMCVVLAIALAGLAWVMLRFLSALNASEGEAAVIDVGEFVLTPSKGWAVAICLSIAALCFIFSRFVAGMSKHEAWQNLRGGAGYMVGNSLMLAAIATGVIFRFFENDKAIIVVAYIIPIVMLLMAAETILNLILNFYRPRIPGEVPRPAFDSRVLSILAAPDSLVRSINEAVNYQFGFDLTSTWGYQLLVRSAIKLAGIGLVVLLLLSCIVIIEPNQQAVKLAGGRIVGDEVHEGIMLKLPWPLQSAQVHNVSTLRTLSLTSIRRRPQDPSTAVNVWMTRQGEQTSRDIEPFLVGRSRLDPSLGVGESDADVAGSHSLLHAEVLLQFRIRRDGNGLLDYLRFAPDTKGPRQRLSMRLKTLRALALREVSQHLSRMSLDAILASERSRIGTDLCQRIQEAYDARKTGIEVVNVSLPLLKPYGEAANKFEDLMIAGQEASIAIGAAERTYELAMTQAVGDVEAMPEVLAEVTRYNALLIANDADAPEVVEQRQRVESLLVSLGGAFGQMIEQAETQRWIDILSSRAQDSRVQGQLPLYRAAPDLYRQREIMRVLKSRLGPSRKVLVAVDPARVNVDIEFQEINSQFFIAGQNPEESDQ
ncbi:MAG: SPFH domain-containing protein [Planctomycetota bacterium]|jgi:regulator of protease activity HflC (stomatin/prohibitin superfamily)